jgi:hemolysin activation/secretion protein
VSPRGAIMVLSDLGVRVHRGALALRSCLAALAMLCVSHAAIAQVIPGAALPGREREQLLDRRPVTRAQPGGPSIALPSTQAPAGAAQTTLVIRRIQIVGSTVYGDEQLAVLYRDLINRPVTLDAVYDLAKRITAKYGADGYVLSRAIVPPQELNPRGAVIRIQVVEGWVSRVEWPRDKLARYRDFFSDYSAKIIADRPVNIRTLERYLLLANDLPGLKFTSTLQASKTDPNSSVLIIEVTEKRVDFLARFDNRGTEARGPYQFLVAPTVNNLFGVHEAFTFAYAGVTEIRELQFVGGNYRHVVNSEGLTAFVNGSYSWGRPGTQALRDLDYRTRSTIVEAGMYQPIIRARERNLTLTGFAFLSDNYSFINLTNPDPFQVDRLRGARARVDADIADSLNGINQFSFTASQGLEGLGSTSNDNPLATRAAGKVNFTKFEGYASRLQPLFDRFSALVAAYGQYAATSLLASEQCGYGGRVFGRAYDPSELLGDHCWMASGELRYDIPGVASPFPDTQLYGYTDVGQVFTIEPAVGTAAQTTAASAGGGVRWRWQNLVLIDLSAAKAIEGPRNDWRFFFITTVRH